MNAVKCIATLALVMWLPTPATAQTSKYPSKVIRLVVGYTPGGGTDIVARLLAQQITDATGQQVVVENRPGAATNIAAEYVAKAPNDGYTLLLMNVTQTVNATLYPKLNYDLVNDFAPIAMFASAPLLLLVHPSFPARNVKDFVAVAKKNPGKLNYSTAGSGTTQHLSGEMLALQIGVPLTHIPYKGSAPSMTALASGEVEFSFNNIPASQPMMSPGRVRALAITSEKRSPLMPELPTMIEGGLPGFITYTWFGLGAPAGTPRVVVNLLNALIVQAVQKDNFRGRLAQMGADPIAQTPEYFRKFIVEEIERWGKVVRATNAKPE